MRRLAAIAAIFRASVGLDAKKPAQLDLVGIEILAVNGLRLKQKVVEGRVVERLGFRSRPGGSAQPIGSEVRSGVSSFITVLFSIIFRPSPGALQWMLKTRRMPAGSLLSKRDWWRA